MTKPVIKLGVLTTDPDFFENPAYWAAFSDRYEILDYSAYPAWDAATLLQRVRAVDVVATGWRSPRLPPALSRDFGRLKWVCHMRGGVRHVVDRPLIEAGLLVTNWGDQVADVAEGAMALLFACLKQLSSMDRWCRTGVDGRMPRIFEQTLRKLDVGLYGYGPIGRHMARMLQAFGANVAIYDPYARDVPAGIRVCKTLRELFQTCPVVSLHCGLNDVTRNSVTRELLELLPQGGILINTARGAVVVEQDLADMLAAHRICAGVDVIAVEGTPPEIKAKLKPGEEWDPWLASPLSKVPNVILTRHKIAGSPPYPAGHKPLPQLPDHIARNLAAFAAGAPLTFLVTAQEYDLKT